MPEIGITAGLVGLLLWGAGCAHPGRLGTRELLWSGEVTVRGTLVVAEDERLEIRPGTRVHFAFRDDDGDGAGDARIVVKGSVVAAGTADAPIVFAPERRGEGGAAGWSEVLVEDGAGARFEECRFSGAQQAVHAHRTPLTLERCLFEDNAIAVRFTGGPVVVRRCRFAGNGTALRYWESSPEVVANRFEGNGTAVFVRERSARTVLAGNNFEASADYHVKLGETQAADVSAPGNWWGSARPEEIERLIFDREDADYLGRVRYDPPAPGRRRVDTP